MIDAAKGERLLHLAREAILSALNKKRPEYSEADGKRGVFVTLHKEGKLRGCIGFPEPVYPLEKAVALAAISAAFDDSRFPPLERQELSKIKIEVSVLSLPKLIAVKSPDDYENRITLGSDGLILRSPEGQGLLLPQVAQEYGWSPKEFLENLSLKAGLGKSHWKRPGTQIFKFQAQIFSEMRDA